MDEMPISKIAELEQKIDALQLSIDRLRRVFFWLIVISVALVVIPAIGLVFAIPQFLSVYSGI